ncbi:MAG: hypothetical protein AUI93_04265 [Crenarchaeota archaeon 13_1_40CM_3_52_10]|nr:MAG: hypothetical protein AUI93_04265 [Crenarchaeota archaeon 13_1_40CM_3_52_10]
MALKMNPEFAFAHSEFGAALVSTSSVDEGTAEIERALKLWKDNVWMKADLAYAYIAANKKPRAEKILRELEEISREKYVPETVTASVKAVLGEKDQAFESLNRAVQENTSQIALLNDPMFDGLRTDPRFETLLERIGLS